MGTVSTQNKRTLLIAGGGTGGHLFPGIAVAEEWCAQLGPDQVVFLGSPSGMESSVIPQNGYPFLPLESRRLKNSNALQKVGKLTSNARHLAQSSKTHSSNQACLRPRGRWLCFRTRGAHGIAAWRTICCRGAKMHVPA